MAQVGRYILSVTASALVLGIFVSFLDPKTTTAKLIRFTGGIWLLFVIIQPVSKIDLDPFLDALSSFQVEGEYYSRQAVEQGRDALSERIIQQTQAYILDKAQACGLEVSVTVCLSGDDIPVPETVSVEYRGKEEDRQKLQSILETQLNIPKERQTWTGMN